jgi:hypothetical protein
MLDVPLRAGEEVVETDDVVALGDQPVAQVRSQESGASCHQDCFFFTHYSLPKIVLHGSASII